MPNQEPFAHLPLARKEERTLPAWLRSATYMNTFYFEASSIGTYLITCYDGLLNSRQASQTVIELLQVVAAPMTGMSLV